MTDNDNPNASMEAWNAAIDSALNAVKNHSPQPATAAAICERLACQQAIEQLRLNTPPPSDYFQRPEPA